MTPGVENPGIYRTLKDVLKRQAEVTSVRFEPDAIQKRYLAAAVDPEQVVPPTGPEPPQLEVRWTLTPPHDEFRIDYADPNINFHCGWHQDDDHDDFGAAHFQYQTAPMKTPAYEGVAFEAARKHDIERVVVASSSSVYGKPEYLPYDETHPTTPVSPYGVSKLATEQYARVHNEVYGLPTVSLRYLTVYGPHVQPNMAMIKLVSRCLHGEPRSSTARAGLDGEFTSDDNADSALEVSSYILGRRQH